jgi:hypothetical protein
MFPTKTLKSYRGRGQVYSWLRAHQDSVAEKLGREEATWPLLVVEMAAHGVVGGRGAPPTPKAAAKVWRRVCADLREAAGAQRKAAASKPPPRPGPVYPSRISPDWRPEEVTPEPRPRQLPGTAVVIPPASRPPIAVPVGATAAPATETQLVPQEEIDAMLDRTFATFDKFDWYLMGSPPKRKAE